MIITVTMNPTIDISASTPRVEPVRKLRCRNDKRDPGGGGINVARVASRLGAECRAIYPAGGSSGALLGRLLGREGVASLPVEVAGDTRESFTVLDEGRGEQYRFLLPGCPLEEAEWQACLDRVAAEPAQGGILVASGSLPPGVPADFGGRLAAIAAAEGARFAVDTSGDALQAALEHGVYLAKPNLGELRRLVGRPLEEAAEWEAAARELVAQGRAEVIALTLGERGAFLAARGLALRAAPLPVKLVSAVGAGDSFLAAMLWRLTLGKGLEDAFRYGVAAGSAALLTPGTELCRPDDVERLCREVRPRPRLIRDRVQAASTASPAMAPITIWICPAPQSGSSSRA